MIALQLINYIIHNHNRAMFKSDTISQLWVVIFNGFRCLKFKYLYNQASVRSKCFVIWLIIFFSLQIKYVTRSLKAWVGKSPDLRLSKHRYHHEEYHRSDHHRPSDVTVEDRRFRYLPKTSDILIFDKLSDFNVMLDISEKFCT